MTSDDGHVDSSREDSQLTVLTSEYILLQIVPHISIADAISLAMISKATSALLSSRSFWMRAISANRFMHPFDYPANNDLTVLCLEELKAMYFNAQSMDHKIWAKDSRLVNPMVVRCTQQVGLFPCLYLLAVIPGQNIILFAVTDDESRLTSINAYALNRGGLVTTITVSDPVPESQKMLFFQQSELKLEVGGKFIFGFYTAHLGTTIANERWLFIVSFDLSSRSLALMGVFRRPEGPRTTEFVPSVFNEQIVVHQTMSAETKIFSLTAVNILSPSTSTVIQTDIQHELRFQRMIRLEMALSSTGDLYLLADYADRTYFMICPRNILPYDDIVYTVQEEVQLHCQSIVKPHVFTVGVNARFAHNLLSNRNDRITAIYSMNSMVSPPDHDHYGQRTRGGRLYVFRTWDILAQRGILPAHRTSTPSHTFSYEGSLAAGRPAPYFCSRSDVMLILTPSKDNDTGETLRLLRRDGESGTTLIRTVHVNEEIDPAAQIAFDDCLGLIIVVDNSSWRVYSFDNKADI